LNKELHDWVKKQEAKGYNHEQIYSYLIKSGYAPEDAEKAFKSDDHHELLYAIGLLLILIIVGGSLYYYYYLQEDPEPKPPVIIPNKTIEPPDIDNTVCKTTLCFEAKFTLCESKILEQTILKGVIFEYEIYGPSENLCEVRTKAVTNPNPSWEGKEMVCLLDNTKSFEYAVKDTSRCTGELHDEMSGNATDNLSSI